MMSGHRRVYKFPMLKYPLQRMCFAGRQRRNLEACMCVIAPAHISTVSFYMVEIGSDIVGCISDLDNLQRLFFFLLFLVCCHLLSFVLTIAIIYSTLRVSSGKIPYGIDLYSTNFRVI